MICLAKTVSGKQMLCRGMGEIKTSVNKLVGEQDVEKELLTGLFL